MKFFKHKHNHRLVLTPTDNFDVCAGAGHIVTTFQYGSHPARVYAFCPFCEKYAILQWKDTTGRFLNRLQFSITYIYAMLAAFAGLGLIGYVLFLYLTKKA